MLELIEKKTLFTSDCSTVLRFMTA